MTRLYDRLIGIPWFRPERYDDPSAGTSSGYAAGTLASSARARMADRDRLPPTYDLWREGAEQREHQVRREGDTPLRVYVDDEMFISFCTGPDNVLDSKARMRFAADRARCFKANIPDYDHPGFWPGAKRRK